MANDANNLRNCILHISRVANALGTTATAMCDSWLDGNLTGVRAETLIKLCDRYGTTVSAVYYHLVGLDD